MSLWFHQRTPPGTFGSPSPRCSGTWPAARAGGPQKWRLNYGQGHGVNKDGFLIKGRQTALRLTTSTILLGMEGRKKLKEKDKQLHAVDLRSTRSSLFPPIKMHNSRRHTQQHREMIACQARTKIWPAPVLTIQDLFWRYLIYMGWTPDGETLRRTAAGPLQQRDTGHFRDSISLTLVVITTTPPLPLGVKCGQHISLHRFTLLPHLSILKVWLFDSTL